MRHHTWACSYRLPIGVLSQRAGSLGGCGFTDVARQPCGLLLGQMSVLVHQKCDAPHLAIVPIESQRQRSYTAAQIRMRQSWCSSDDANLVASRSPISPVKRSLPKLAGCSMDTVHEPSSSVDAVTVQPFARSPNEAMTSAATDRLPTKLLFYLWPCCLVLPNSALC